MLLELYTILTIHISEDRQKTYSIVAGIQAIFFVWNMIMKLFSGVLFMKSNGNFKNSRSMDVNESFDYVKSINLDPFHVPAGCPSIFPKGSSPSPSGPLGPQGAQGPQGPQGTQGIAGAQGPQGDQGVNGAQGSQGDQGTTGAQGSQGDQGATGAQGPQGDRD